MKTKQQEFLDSARRQARKLLLGGNEVEDERDLDYMLELVNGLIAINCEIWGRCKDFRFSSSSIPSGVTVKGAGVEEVNGYYRCSGKFDGVDMYTKSGSWEGNEVIFSLYRFKKTRWYISIIPENKEPGTGEDVDFYRANNDMPIVHPWDHQWKAHRNNVVNDAACRSNDCPTVIYGWMPDVGLASDRLLSVPLESETELSTLSKETDDVQVRMVRISFEKARVVATGGDRKGQSLHIAAHVSLRYKDFGLPPSLPDALTNLIAEGPRKKQKNMEIFPDYEGYIVHASLLQDDVLKSFLQKLQPHLEDVQYYLGEIEEWLAEAQSIVNFLNDLFEKKLKVVYIGNNWEKGYHAVENGTCTLFKGDRSPGVMDLTFDISTEKGRCDLKSFYTFVQRFNKDDA